MSRRASILGSLRWQFDGEARPNRVAREIKPVLGPNRAVMCLDDLLGNGEAEAGMLAEGLTRRALGIEAIEDRREFAFGNSGAVIIDHDADSIVAPARADNDHAAGRAERDRVVD